MKSDLDLLEERIRGYLTAHPDAADTVQGIRAWWLGGSYSHYSAATVEVVLHRLVKKHEVVQSISLSGETIYAKWRD